MGDTTIKVGGVQRKVTAQYVKVGGTWRQVKFNYAKVNDSWRNGWKDSFATPSFLTFTPSGNLVRNSTVNWQTSPVTGAHYEYQTKYNNGPWSQSVFHTTASGSIQLTSTITHTSFQMRIRTVAPTQRDRASSWRESSVVGLTPAKLTTPSNITYASSVVRGGNIRITFHVNDTNAVYKLGVRYHNGSTTSSSIIHTSSYPSTGNKTFDHTTSTATTWQEVQYFVYKERTGYLDSDYRWYNRIPLLNRTLGTIGSITVPTPQRGSNIVISWPSVSNAGRYQLERRYNSGSWSRVYWGENRSYSYGVSSSSNNTTIQFRVRATATNYEEGGWRTSSNLTITLPPLKTSTWTATSSKSWRPNFGGQYQHDDYVYQGQWNEGGTTWGNYSGMAMFDHNSIRNTLTGKTIEKVEMYFYRINQGGYVAGQAINLHTHNYSTWPGTSSRPTMSHLQGPFSSFARAEGKWITVSNNLAKRFVDGTAKGIGLFRSDGNGYLYMSSNVKIKVSYR